MAKQKRKNTGTPFELQLQQIYQQILALNGEQFKNIRVERRAKIDSKAIKKKGKPLKHEIDLYWEFQSSGITHKVCVQAKDDEVTLGMVLTFKAVLDDIAGQPRGIMVTSRHFQEGAFETAKQNGIELYHLRPPGEGDGIHTINLTIQPIIVEVKSLSLNFYDQVPQLDPPINFQLRVGEFFDESGHPFISVSKLLKDAAPSGFDDGLHSGEYVFEQPAYIHTGRSDISRLRIKSVIAQYQFTKQAPREINLFLQHVLESLTVAKSFLIDNKGVVRQAGQKVSQRNQWKLRGAVS